MAEAITTHNASAWDKWRQHFVATRDAFNASFAQLMNKQGFMATQPPAAQAEYQRRIAEAMKKREDLAKLEEVNKQVSAALPMVSAVAHSAIRVLPGGNIISPLLKAIGLGAYEYDEDGNLGIAPVVIVIGLATATAMVAAIAYFVTDNNKYIARLNSIQQLTSSGLSPQQATQIVDNQARIQAQQAIFGNPLLMAALAAAAIFVVPPVLRMLDKGKANA